MTFNLATIQEAIAAAIPDRECIVYRDRRFTWRAFNERTRRLANFLARRPRLSHRARRTAELGVRPGPPRPLSLQLPRVPRGHARRVQGARRAVQRQLPLRRRRADLPARRRRRDARWSTTRASRPTLARIRAALPQPRRAAPGRRRLRRTRCCPGAVDYEEALAAGVARRRPASTWSPDDLYILYTGGTTGMPKGVLWRQEDIFFGALGGTPPGGPKFASVEARRRGARSTAASARLPRRRSCTAPRTGWRSPRCTRAARSSSRRTPERLDPDDIWSTVEREQRAASLTIVGDAFARPLLDQLDAKHVRPVAASASSLSGGAILSPALKDGLPRAHPAPDDHRRLRRLGDRRPGPAASPTRRRQGVDRQLPHERGHAGADAAISAAPLAPGSAEQRLAGARRPRAARLLQGRREDAPRRSRSIGGVRYAVPGDHATVGADGTIIVLGRGSVSINSGGEKIYPEEVEQALKHHPSVYDAVVVGTPERALRPAGHRRRRSSRAGATADRRRAAPTSPPAPRPLQAAARHRLRRRDGAQPDRQGRLPLGEDARARGAWTAARLTSAEEEHVARLPYPDPATVPDEVRTLLAAFPPLNIFRMLPHAANVSARIRTARHRRSCRRPLSIARLRELVILRVGQRSPAPYEWQQHVPIGRACGVSDDEIAALERDDARGERASATRDRIVLRLTDELLVAPRASDATLAAMRAHLLRSRGLRGGPDDRLLHDGGTLPRDDRRRSRDRQQRSGRRA